MLTIRIIDESTRAINGTCEISPGSPLAQLPGTYAIATVGDVVKQFGRPLVTTASIDADKPRLIWPGTVIAFDYVGPIQGFCWYPPPIPTILKA